MVKGTLSHNYGIPKFVIFNTAYWILPVLDAVLPVLVAHVYGEYPEDE